MPRQQNLSAILRRAEEELWPRLYHGKGIVEADYAEITWPVMEPDIQKILQQLPHFSVSTVEFQKVKYLKLIIRTEAAGNPKDPK